MDLRDWIKLLKEKDKLQEINVEVDWNLEASAITNMASRVTHKAVLFNKVKDYPGCKLFGGTVNITTRKKTWLPGSLMLGLPESTSRKALELECARRERNAILPTEVAAADAPCKEVIKMGKEANIFDLPVPYIHSVDGGRYLTHHAIVMKDPVVGWTNYSLYRVECIAPRKLSALLVPYKQGGSIFFQRYEMQGKNCPFCIAIGGDPALFWVYCTSIAPGVCELDVAGGFRGEPIRVVRAETNDLLVPAESEIIIEGEILAGRRVDEGPFGEFSGYVHGRTKNPEFRINCITHRKNPILPFAVMSMSLNDTVLIGVSRAVQHLTQLRQLGVNAVEANSVKDPDDIGDIVRLVEAPAGRAGGAGGAWSIITDPEVSHDIPIRAWREFALNTDPRRDFHFSDMDGFNLAWSFRTDYEEREKGINMSKVWIDATTGRKPKELKPQDASFERAFPESLRKKVGEEWGKQGFDRPFEEEEPVDPDWFMKD